MRMAVLCRFLAVFLSFCLVGQATGQNHVGRILDGYQDACTVQRTGEDYPCGKDERLLPGDQITKKPNIDRLRVKWGPYASGKRLSSTSMVVDFEPPRNKGVIIRKLEQIVASQEDLARKTITRYGSSEPQPGNNATLIPGQKATFSWDTSTGRFIVFKDSKGKEVYRKELKGESSVELTPDEIGMRAGETYTWSITGSRSAKQNKVKLLSQDTAQQVMADLVQIDKEPRDKVGKAIYKAVYLQFMSDAYPQDIDLYWLSLSCLKAIRGEKETMNEKDKVLVDELRNNYLNHLR